MSEGEPHRVELTLGPAGDHATPHTFVVTLRDLSLTGVEIGFTRLFADMSIDDRGTTLADVVELFATSRSLRHAEALGFGQFLYRRLLGASEDLRRLWAEIDADRKRTGRPLHLVVVLPAHAGTSDGDELPWSVAELPFELLADDRGFLFQRFGNVLVRTFHGLTRRTPSIPHGGKAMQVWANPQVLSADGTLVTLPGDVFDRHAAILAQAVPALGLALVPSCDRASRRRLDAHLSAHAPVHLVSIVAHGAPTGGAMLLHDEQDGQATDNHAPVLAQQLATMLRAGGVDVALLWTCYGARRHRHVGSLAEALLRPDGGDVPVVVASHAALDAAATVEMARVLFDALSGAARHDFERALSQTWQRALGEDNLQWAAPVYYARPEPTQPAHIEEAMVAADLRQVVDHRAAVEPWSPPRPMPPARLDNQSPASPAPISVTNALWVPPIVLHPPVYREPWWKRAWHAVVDVAFWLVGWPIETLTDFWNSRRGADPPPDAFAPPDTLRPIAPPIAPRVFDGVPNVATRSPTTDDAFTRPGLRPPTMTGEPKISTLSICQRCGKENQDHYKFCLGCGAELSSQPSGARSSALAPADTLAMIDTVTRGAVALEHAPPLTEHFRGRDDDVARGVALLAERRLVSILGMPGIGKTALSLAIADRVLAHGAFDRAVWHPLDGVRTVDVLAARLAQDAQARDMDAAALAHAMGRDTSWLVVLDNAEDLIDTDRAGLQQLLDALLREHTAVRFLLTTRRRLGDLPAAPEARLPVGRLAPPYDLDLFQATAGERLRRKARDRNEVRELVALLDGHPQSIVLVAGQVGEFPLAAIRRRIERDDVDAVVAAELIGEQDAGDGRAAQRAKRLLASLDLSYQPLAERHPAAAEMFAWLGALPAGLPAVLAPRVFGEDVDERVAVLLQHNLVEQRGRDRRMGMPAPLRWYAARHIEDLAEDRQRTLLASTTHALAAWVAAMQEQAGTPTARHANGRAVVEQPNLVALMARVKAAPEASLALPWSVMVAGWSRVMQLAGRPSTAIPVVEQAHAMQPPGSEGEANTLQALGDLYMRTDRLKEAEQSYDKALPLAQTIEARLSEANTLWAQGNLYARTDRLNEAEQSYGKALPLYRTIEDRLGEANTLKALGDLYVRTERLKEAEQSYGKALPLYRTIEDRLGEANTLRALGDLYVRTGRLKEAEQSYDKVLPLYQMIEDRLGEANTGKMLGELYVRTARLKEAEQSYGKALPLYRTIEDRLGEANTLKALGELYVRTERLKEAEQSYGNALLLYQTIEDRLGEANTRRALGDLYVSTKRLKEAEQSYGNARLLYQTIEARLGEANTLQGMGNLALAQGKVGRAFSHYRQALALHEVIESALGVAAAHGYLARAARAAGALERAVVLGARARQILHGVDDRFGQRVALDDMGSALAGLENDTGTVAARVLAWELSCSIGESDARARGELLAQVFEGLNPAAAPPHELIAKVELQLIEAIQACQDKLAARGEDPLSPLPGVEDDPTP